MAKQKLLTLFGIILCLPIIFFYGCRKTDYSSAETDNQKAAAKFLTLPTGVPDAVKRVAEKLKTLNQNGNLVSSIAAQDGLPQWHKAIIKDRGANTLAREAGEDTIVCIPLVLEGKNYVNACIYAQLNGTVSLSLYKSKEYAGYGFGDVESNEKNAEKYALQFMMLDYKTLGHKDFTLFDSKLFAKVGLPERAVISKRTVHIELTGQPGVPEGSYVQICEQTRYLDCTTNHSCCPNGSCSGCQQSCWHTRTTCVSVPVTVISWAEWDWGTGTTLGNGTPAFTPPFSGGSTGNSYTPPTTGSIGNAGSNYQNVSEYHCNPTPWLYDSNYPECPTENIWNGWLPQDFDIDPPSPPFIWSFTNDDGSNFVDSNPLEEPDFQFEPSDNYETLYPRFTNMVKNLKTFVKNNPKVLNALQKYSGFTKQQILDRLSFGQGPTIKVEDMNFKFGFYKKGAGVNTLHIRKSYVTGLEQSFLESTQQATAFLLAVTILHEFVHLGTAQNNISEGVYDFGSGFERDAFNVTVSDDNAGTVSIRFNAYF